MKRFFILLSLLALAACQSSEPTKPELAPINSSAYLWNTNISYALNIARMANPAKVGFGLTDQHDFKMATTNRNSTTDMGISAGVMTLAGGLPGGAMSVFMDGVNNSRRSWRPSLVDLIPVQDASAPENTGTFENIHSIVSTNIRNSLAFAKEITWLGSYSVNRKSLNNSLIILGGNECKEAIQYGAYNKDTARTHYNKDLSTVLVEKANPEIFTKYCDLAFDIRIAGITEINGISHYIVVSELQNGAYYFLRYLNAHYSGHVLNPDSFNFRTADVDRVRIRKVQNPFPFVARNGMIYVFSLDAKPYGL